jgi:hypothetical protein
MHRRHDALNCHRATFGVVVIAHEKRYGRQIEISMSREFFKVVNDWPEGSATITFAEEDRSPLRYLDVYKGKCGADFLDGFQITKYSPGKLLDLLPNNLGWPIASPRCCECVLRLSANEEVQLLPMKPLLLLPGFPKELAGYCLLTTRTVFDCLELASPDIRWFDEARKLVRNYRKLPIRPSVIPANVNYFCVKRLPALHVVSSELKDALVHVGITGWDFIRCDT